MQDTPELAASQCVFEFGLEHSALPCAGGWRQKLGQVLAAARENPHAHSEVALELAENFTAGNAVQAAVNVEVNVLADESNGTIAQSEVTSANVQTGRSGLAITTVPASESQGGLAAATLYVRCSVPTIVDAGTVALVIAASDQR